jgi:hypothetical protein
MGQDKKLITNTEFFGISSLIDKVQMIVLDHTNSTKNQILDILKGHLTTCYGVSSVSPVTGDRNNRNKHNTVTGGVVTDLPSQDVLRVYINRLEEKGKVISNKTKSPYTYSITQKGKTEIYDGYREWVDKHKLQYQ